jgi:hypothetical protein
MLSTVKKTLSSPRGAALLRKGKKGNDPVDELYGALRLPKPVDVLLDEMRGPRRETRSKAAVYSPEALTGRTPQR